MRIIKPFSEPIDNKFYFKTMKTLAELGLIKIIVFSTKTGKIRIEKASIVKPNPSSRFDGFRICARFPKEIEPTVAALYIRSECKDFAQFSSVAKEVKNEYLVCWEMKLSPSEKKKATNGRGK